MKKNPVLVILAAGMGSRYGGLKQIDPVDEENNKIIDFSMFDAKRAGFNEVVFIIKNAIAKDFIEQVGKRVEKYMKVHYVYQELDKLPEGFTVPEGREKPWGTGHALLCAKDVIDAPFAIINADDFYGKVAYEQIYRFLTSENQNDSKYHYAMVGYELTKTLTKNGSVARGVCEMDSNHYLQDIKERTKIVATEKGGAYTEDDGKTWHDLEAKTLVSMNFWGFYPNIFDDLEKEFKKFLETNTNPLKGEFYIPIFVDTLIKANKADVKVLPTTDTWFGVTYKEDKEHVVSSIKELKKNGVYPNKLWN